MSYVLHYAPDNASLVVRLALDHLGVAYETKLLDRSKAAHKAAPYLALNPNGLIPTLETPQGALFETGAILLWLADTHGGLGPAPGDQDRADFLKWLFFLSNTLHPCLRRIFYPDTYCADPTAYEAVRASARQAVLEHCAKLMGFSFDGFEAGAPWFIKLFGVLVFKPMLGKSHMKPGIKLPAKAASLMPRDEVAFEEGLSAMRAQLDRIDAGEQMTHKSPVLGKMSHDQWILLHLDHCRMHFGFLQ